MFAIVKVSEPETHIEVFDDGAEAGRKARELNSAESARNTTDRYRVIRVEAPATNDNEWRDREYWKLANGDYIPVPWRMQWWRIQDHYAHVSLKDPSKLAYTPNEEYGRADRQVTMRPGKYLTKYYSDKLTTDEIREWAARFAAENEGNELRFAHSPDEIQHVYENGPNSCMAHRAGDYGSSVHPVRVYGAGDLAVAYLIDGEDEDRVTARALCWPEKKSYGRVYGDAGRLIPLLRDAGYESNGKFDGARLLRIEDDCGQFVCPYLDQPNYGVDDCGDHLEIGSELDAQRTSGLTGPLYRCAYCEEAVDIDDHSSVEGEVWCASCVDNYAWYCDNCHEYHSDNNTERLSLTSGETVCDNADVGSCVECDSYVWNDNLQQGVDHSYCEDCADNMEQTPCGLPADNEDDCDCSECERARNDEVDEEAQEASPVTLRPTTPTIDDPRQLTSAAELESARYDALLRSIDERLGAALFDWRGRY